MGPTLTINVHFAERQYFLCYTVTIALYEEVSAFNDLVAHQCLYGGWTVTTVHEADTVGRLVRTSRSCWQCVCQTDREVMQPLI